MYKLRELERDDLKRINKWRNDPNLIACLGAPYRYINEDVDGEWYTKYLHTRSDSVRCAIIDDENEKEVLGLVSLLSINYINRSGELHIMIGDSENRGKGLGTFAVRAMVQHAFNNLNLRRVELLVLEDNIRAQNLYKKVGFQVEGMKREAVYKDGVYKNMYMMSILKSEYKY